MSDLPIRRIPSAEFRAVYVRVTEPVDVTANGRVIGRWIPALSVIPEREPERPVHAGSVTGPAPVARPAGAPPAPARKKLPDLTAQAR